MKIIYKQGNIVDADEHFILHQVNCQGKMGKGVAKAIRDKWPEVNREYVEYCNEYKKYNLNNLLGKIQFVSVFNHIIINAFGQFYYGNEEQRYSNYEAVYNYLERTKDRIITCSSYRTLAIPYKMACGLGGGNWDVVLAMIKSIFKNSDIEITIYKYEL